MPYKQPILRIEHCALCGSPFNLIKKSPTQLHCSIKCAQRSRYSTPQAVSKRFWQKVNKTPGCWLWQGQKGRYGHGYIVAFGERLASRVSWILHFGTIPDGLSVLHKCDVGACVRPNHLFLGTQADNMADAAKKGRMPRGERSVMAKLTEPIVREIRSLHESGMGHKRLAKRFSVSGHSIRMIIHRRTWRHVTD